MIDFPGCLAYSGASSRSAVPQQAVRRDRVEESGGASIAQNGQFVPVRTGGPMQAMFADVMAIVAETG
jgi:hypothetical protein